MVTFKLIDHDARLHAESVEDKYVCFEGTIADWENCYGGLGGSEQDKLDYIREWADDEMDCYMVLS